MKTIYQSARPDSDFTIVEVDGKIYAIDRDSQVGGWGKYPVDRTTKFVAGSNEFVEVSHEGDVVPNFSGR